MRAPWRLGQSSRLSGRRAAVSRIRCRGDKWETDMSLDVNVDIYPLKARTQSEHHQCHRAGGSLPSCVPEQRQVCVRAELHAG